jgi:hypothetical protein
MKTTFFQLKVEIGAGAKTKSFGSAMLVDVLKINALTEPTFKKSGILSLPSL